MRFLHCADLHLGIQLYNDARAEDFWKNFELVLAASKSVDFVVIAGDIFDTRTVGPDVLDRFVNTVSRSGVSKILTISGNHDRQTRSGMSWLEFLDRRGLVKYINGLHSFECDGMTMNIHGFENKTVMRRFFGDSPRKPIGLNILLLHEGVTGQMEHVEGVHLEEIPAIFDYVGLGHYHHRYEYPERNVYNPGSIERCNISESGGGYYVYHDGVVTFHELPKRGVERAIVDIARCETSKDIEDAVVKRLIQIPGDYVVEITLVGKSQIKPDVRSIQDSANKGRFFVKVRNHIQPLDVDLSQSFGEDFEVGVIKSVAGPDAGKILTLKALVGRNPTVEELRRIISGA